MSPPNRFGDKLGRVWPEWVLRAKCRRLPAHRRNDFHPEHGSDPGAATTRAKTVCAGCPVRDECRTFGDQVSPTWGIFGGLTALERERRRERLAEGRSAA